MSRFSATQLNYLQHKKSFYHNKDGSQNLKSVLNLDSLEEIQNLIDVFFENIQTLIENQIIESGYCGKDFFLNYKSDNKKEVFFSDSFLSKEELQFIILKAGSYLPILMFYDEDDECFGAIECVHTKYSLRVIKECFEKNLLSTEKFLFIVKPSENNIIKKTSFILPKILYDKIAYLLNLEVDYINEKWVKLYSNDPNDLWLLFKLFHKEASYYIAKNMKKLFDDNYFPPSLITKK